jgi:inosine triphosphate pyrophosphatase
MHIYYVTSNQTKFHEAHLIWSEDRDETELLRAPLDLCEIQGTPKEICMHKAKQACLLAKGPVIVDDFSLHFSAMNGLPGPYIRTFMKHLGADGLFDLVSKFDNTACSALCTIGYLENSEKEPQIFEGQLPCHLSPKKGDKLLHGSGLNQILKIDGCEKTIAEMSLVEFASFGLRRRPLLQLKSFLRKQRNEHS